MRESIWIETPDAVNAAWLMQDTVGRFRARLVQCTGRAWRVLVLPDRDSEVLMADVISLVRRWLRRRGIRETTLHLGRRCLTVRAARAAGTGRAG